VKPTEAFRLVTITMGKWNYVLFDI